MKFRRMELSELDAWTRERVAVDPDALRAAAEIVDDVRARGTQAAVEHAVRLGDLAPGEGPWIERAELDAALESLPADQRALLERVAERIAAFARVQRSSLRDTELSLGGAAVAAQRVFPVRAAGCYAPGGRFPLPSSVLMTAVTARVAGVERILVASPRPTQVTLAAAALAGAQRVLRVGGAQAIAALAYGVGEEPPVDFVCGPGNRYVTAAKRCVFGQVGVDMLAGPSEICVVADEDTEPGDVARDLLAQAEHDVDARVWVVASEPGLQASVERAVERELEDLPTRDVARAALEHARWVNVASQDDVVRACESIAPEHLQLMTRRDGELARRLTRYGGLFLDGAAEVLGDYGAGPNHVLPTGGSASYRGGLSVLDFLCVRTSLSVPAAEGRALAADARDLARLEGLAAHARSAAARC